MNFTCPYCNQVTTITDPNYSDSASSIATSKSEHGRIKLGHKAIACPNQKCKKLFLEVRVSNANEYGSESTVIQKWSLLPQSSAKPQPTYIPEGITQDYYEACAILNLSPKASATLSRRCLQGIVRHFWELPDKNKGKLAAELKFIKDSVDEDTWVGIDAIVKVGNIGAHIENDVNYVVDVEIAEADLLIELIEMLFEDWYVARQKRKDRAERAKQAASNKIQQKREAKAASKASEQSS